MVLSDSEIIKRLKSWNLKIESLLWFNIFDQIWPSSLDIRLWNVFKFYKEVLVPYDKRKGEQIYEPNSPRNKQNPRRYVSI